MRVGKQPTSDVSLGGHPRPSDGASLPITQSATLRDIAPGWRRLARICVLILVACCLLAASAWSLVRLYAYVGPSQPDEKTALIAIAVQAVGGLLLFFGLFFTWKTLRISQHTLRLNQEGQITDRFAKAVELLGAVDDQGGSRLQTRLGAIYALERLGLDSERDRPQVIDILTSYVTARATPQERPSADNLDRVPRYALDGMPPPRVLPDIQAVLAALTRLRVASGEVDPLDLSGVDLRGVRLNRAELVGTDLTDSWLDNASLRGARLADGKLRRAFLTKVDLSEANLDRASMEGIDL